MTPYVTEHPMERNHPDAPETSSKKLNNPSVANRASTQTTSQQRNTAHSQQDTINRNTKTPPIVLRNKEKYTEVMRDATKLNISIIKAKALTDGVAIHPQTEKIGISQFPTTFRKTFTRSHTRHSRGTRCERGKRRLNRKGFHSDTVSRIRSSRDKRPLHLVLVTVAKSEKHMYQIKEILSLVITVEEQQNNARYSQCHRCQKFGNAQSRCTAEPKCVKCAGSHLTSDCKKDHNRPAKCILQGMQSMAKNTKCKQNQPHPNWKNIRRCSDQQQPRDYVYGPVQKL